MRCIRCGGRISEETGICVFCGLKGKSVETEKKKTARKLVEPQYSIVMPYVASIVVAILSVVVCFLPWGKIVYDEFAAEGTVWKLSTVIGDTYYDIPVETSISLLVAFAGWTVGMNLIYVFRSVFGGVYKKRCRRGMLEDTALTISIVGLIVAFWLCEWSADIVFDAWFAVEILLICLNKFVFVRLYNKKHYFMRINDEENA